MRNLIVCCDGTWNTAAQTSSGLPDPTNVVRIYNAVDENPPSGPEQLRYYHPGVGTHGGAIERLKGGAFGAGLGKNVQSAYKWLADHYRPVDCIFAFGFSRGAYTVRSLVGMIDQCGLLDLSQVDGPHGWERVKTAYEDGYRKPWPEGQRWTNDAWAFHDGVEIGFLGVWDTVGSMGIPLELPLLKMLFDPRDYQFHDTRLSGIVQCARHALAIDERRADYAPTLWTEVPPGRDVVQLWFPGCHSDIGGGYLERGLGNSTLKWMMVEAAKKGLVLKPAMEVQVKPDYQDVLHDSTAGVMKLARTEPRCVPPIVGGGASITRAQLDADPGGYVGPGTGVSSTAIARHDDPPIAQCPYWPTRRIDVGKSVKVTVYASQTWNDPCLCLEAGEYEFTAAGQWVDNESKFGPDGDSQHRFSAGDVIRGLGSALGMLEEGYHHLTHDERVDLYGTRRVEDAPWFMLIGVVANGCQVAANLPPKPHQVIHIGSHAECTVKEPGYLYCFANDAWAFYGNNRGSVELAVTRIS